MTEATYSSSSQGIGGATYSRASLVTHMVKNLPAMQETQVQSLGQEDPLEKKMATYSSILAWRIPWTGEPHGGTVHGISELCITEQLSLCFTSDLCIKGSVQFSRSVVSDYLQPHESQHTRPPCPSPTPGVYSNSCPLSR